MYIIGYPRYGTNILVLADALAIVDPVFLLSVGNEHCKLSLFAFGSRAESSSRDNCQSVRTVLPVSGCPMVNSHHRPPIKFYSHSLPETSSFDRYIRSEIPIPGLPSSAISVADAMFLLCLRCSDEIRVIGLRSSSM